MEPVDKDTLRQPPRNVKDTILSRALLLKILLSALVIISGTLFIFWKEVKEVLCGSLNAWWWLMQGWGLCKARWTVPAVAGDKHRPTG